MADKKYTEAIGRRKTSTARVRVTPATKMSFTVNDKDVQQYFGTAALQKIVHDVMTLLKNEDKFEISVHISGGGIHSQSEAVRHGLARIFSLNSDETRTELKKEGFLKRDPRAKERRKFGLKKARKAPQWSKR